MPWGTTWDDADDTSLKPAPKQTEGEVTFITGIKKRFTQCENWEAQARLNFEYDYKFANGDAHNKYQWDNDLVLTRELEDKPCLTINKTAIHNLMVINDAKQNKPGVRIRPVGDEATYEGAQIYQELIYHIEYISSAENVYDSATTWQVEAGVGYWRIKTDYISDKSFDQEIYICRIKDPRSVYLDPNINEQDGSDARFGFIFEDIPKDLFNQEYPDWASIGSSTTLSNTHDMWVAQNYVRVAEYFCKEEKKDKLVTWTTNEQILEKLSDLDDTQKLFYKEIKKRKDLWPAYQFQERKIITEDISWYKIAGDRIIDKGKWLGKYIPIVRLIGTETIIDGRMDRKGHTRALINPQQIYNYSSSANVEFGALQTKSPYIAASAAIEGFEEYYKTANRTNHSYLPYNGIDDDGNEIPRPQRAEAPQSSPAYIEGMKIAQNEMMMATGQYQSQLGENENAKSGVAINARQRQGDRATYHFIDNQAIAIRFTGKILINLIPKIYDTPRIKKILASNGDRINVKVDTSAEAAYQDVTDKNNPQMDNGKKIKEVIFNPDFGMYDIQADTGPSFATKRMETAAALGQIVSADKDFLKIGGDVYFRNLDFPGADTLAERYSNIIPPQVKGEGLPPQVEEIMHKSTDMIQGLQSQVADLTQQVKDKTTELTQKGQRLDLDFKDKTAEHARLDYEAETKRAAALFNTGEGNDEAANIFKPVIAQLIKGMLANGELNFSDNSEPEGLPEGAKKAADGQYYVKQGDGWARVEMQ